MPKNRTQKFAEEANGWKFTKQRPGDLQQSEPRPLASSRVNGSIKISPRAISMSNQIIKERAFAADSNTRQLNDILKGVNGTKRPSDLNMIGSILVGQGTSLDKTGGAL